MSSRRRSTLSDVAVKAGVSVTTASYILNGRSVEMRISQDATKRVQTAAAELQYRPNRNARGLRTATTATIGVISDHVASGSYASRMLTGAFTAARASNHLLVIGETEGDPDVERRLIGEMLDRQVDGVLYTTLATSEVPVPPLLADHRLVMLNCLDVAGKAPAVVPDELEGGRTAADVLIAAGREGQVRVVGQDTDPRAIAGPLRLQGVRERLAEVGVELRGGHPLRLGRRTGVRGRERGAPRPRVDQRPGLPQRPDRDGRLPGAGRARPARARGRGGGLLRRLGPRRLAPTVADLGVPPVRRAGCGRGRRPDAGDHAVSSGSRCRWCGADRQERGQTPAAPST